jgi:hypothetical protein
MAAELDDRHLLARGSASGCGHKHLFNRWTRQPGSVVPGTSNLVQVVNTGTLPPPEGKIVINELMFAPPLPGAEFVELRNSSSSAYDLSGWELNGLSYRFPPGSIIAPNSYLVLAANREAFAEVFGTGITVFDTFAGRLQIDGETLTLLQPITEVANEIAKIRYDTAAPWPTFAELNGASLQLIDAWQDNWRRGNWAFATSNNVPAAQWVYVTATGSASSSRLYLYLQSPGEVYLDDVTIVAGSTPEDGSNLVRNGGFESDLAGSWVRTANFAQSTTSTAFQHSGNSSLHLVAASGGSGSGNALYQDITPP